ncbi:MAG: MATE family efflux transporter [Gemmatimonadota bacterium]
MTEPAASAVAPALAVPSAAAVPTARPDRKFDRSIIEGPLPAAIWKLAWPAMITNIIGGMQGMIDHILVGHYVGYQGNAAIGVSNQIFIMVVSFIMSLFTGMSVLVARFAGANDHLNADRTVYQAFLTAILLSLGVLAPLGYFLSPVLLNFVNAAPGVQALALPYLRIMFVYSMGMLLFYMLGGALRSAGDARTPMILGISMTIGNIILNIILIQGWGPIPAYGVKGSAMGTAIASGLVGAYGIWKLYHGGWVVSFPKGMGYRPDWAIIRELFRFGLPAGFQGIAMNIGGVLMLGFIGSLAASAAAQAAYAVSYSQLFSFITWTSVGLMGAAAAVAGQNLGAHQPDRAAAGVKVAARFGAMGAGTIGLAFLLIPRQLLGIFGMNDPEAVEIGVHLLRVLSVSGIFISTALAYTGGLQGTGDTRSPFYISVVSQIIIPLGICFTVRHFTTLQPMHIWIAILTGHFTRSMLGMWRFNQGKWRTIAVKV